MSKIGFDLNLSAAASGFLQEGESLPVSKRFLQHLSGFVLDLTFIFTSKLLKIKFLSELAKITSAV